MAQRDNDPIEIVPHDDGWPARFDAAERELRSALATWVVDIEHIGSTAVPGLAAKPVIDIMVGVRTLDDTPQIVAAMESLGYEYVPEYEVDMPDRRYFRRWADGRRSHQVHLVERENLVWWDRHLRVRDWLRAHDEDRDRYAALKKELAIAHRDDRATYTDAKTDFIRAIEQQALWGAPEHIDIDGLRIAFRRAGTGPPLLLLHGGLCDSRVWRAQLEDLSHTFTVVAWDAPGCGASSDPPETFLEAAGVERPHVLGHSFGGGLALELYGRHPGIPRTLVLAGAYAGWAGSLPPEEVAARLEASLRIAEHLPISPASARGFISEAMRPATAEELQAIMSDVRPVGARVMARAFAAADLRDVLAHIRVPTLLLYGDRDERAPVHVAEALHAAIPNATLVLMPGLGHGSYLEAPERFNAEVRAFLAGTD